MGKRGPKSIESQATDRAAIITVPRLTPPTTLTDAELVVWSGAVNTMPAGYFSRAQLPLIVAYCRHTVRADVLAVEILRFEAEWIAAEGGLERLDRLHGMADRETRAITACARALRLTLQAQRTAGAAGTANRALPDGPRPWDRDWLP